MRGEKQCSRAEGRGTLYQEALPDQYSNSPSVDVRARCALPEDQAGSKPTNKSDFGGRRETKLHLNGLGLLFESEGRLKD